MGPLAMQLSTEDYNKLIHKHGDVDKLARVSEKIAGELDAELAQRNAHLTPEPVEEEPIVLAPITYRRNASVILESAKPAIDIYA